MKKTKKNKGVPKNQVWGSLVRFYRHENIEIEDHYINRQILKAVRGGGPFIQLKLKRHYMLKNVTSQYDDDEIYAPFKFAISIYIYIHTHIDTQIMHCDYKFCIK